MPNAKPKRVREVERVKPTEYAREPPAVKWGMKIFVTVAVFSLSAWVIADRSSQDATQKGAWALLGAIVTYWLKD